VLTPRLVSSLSYEQEECGTLKVLEEHGTMDGIQEYGRNDGRTDMEEYPYEQPLINSSDVTLDGPLREPRRLSPSPGRLPLLRHRGIAGVRQTGRMVG
jgi:hypothetical protein